MASCCSVWMCNSLWALLLVCFAEICKQGADDLNDKEEMAIFLSDARAKQCWSVAGVEVGGRKLLKLRRRVRGFCKQDPISTNLF